MLVICDAICPIRYVLYMASTEAYINKYTSTLVINSKLYFLRVHSLKLTNKEKSRISLKHSLLYWFIGTISIGCSYWVFSLQHTTTHEENCPSKCIVELKWLISTELPCSWTKKHWQPNRIHSDSRACTFKMKIWKIIGQTLGTNEKY